MSLRPPLALLPVLLIGLTSFASAADAPPVKRVTLSTSGLIDIERVVDVSGAATLTLPVPLEAVDDVLKTLAIQDPAGAPRAVRLPGREPFAEAFRGLPFAAPDLEGPAQLLAALRGAEVTVAGPRTLAGMIVSVAPEPEMLPGGQTRQRNRLTLLTAKGLDGVIIEDATQIAFADPTLRAQVEDALTASLRNQAREQRVLEILLSDGADRKVSLSYVVAAPLWKPSYRLLLPRSGEKAELQGWAVLENMSGGDWTDVTLALTSGAPATYRQSLYQSYYPERPEMPVQLQSGPKPKVDGGAVTMTVASPAPMPSSPAPRASMAAPIQTAPGRAASFDQAPAARPPSEAAENDAQVSFQLDGTFTVPSGQSLMVPLIAENLPMQRLSLYQPQTNSTTPLAALRLTNPSKATLPAGILTIYAGERADFAGDAQLPVLPRGESRLISYALDQKVQIQRSESAAQTVASLAAAQGVLRASRKSIVETSYRIKAPADEDRLLVIEHPRRADYALEGFPAAETTPTHHRVSVSLKAGETTTLRVPLVRMLEEQVRILDLPATTAAVWSQYATEAGNQQAIAAFATLASLRRAVTEVERRLGELDARVAAVKSDQERQRANLGVVPRDSDIAKRSLAAISMQEDELALLAKTRAGLEADRAKAQQALETGVAGLRL